MRRGILATAILISAAGAAFWFYARQGVHGIATSATPANLPLEVERDGHIVRLFWDIQSEPIRKAPRATLFIQDGAYHGRMDLEPRELSVGSLSYWPQTPEVLFRLEISSGDRLAAGEIRSLGNIPEIPVQAGPEPLPAAVEDPQPQSAPELDPEPASLPSPRAALGGHAVRADALSVAMSSEPVMNPPRAGITQRIPLLRRFGKQGASFVPPQPVRKVRPTLGANEQHSLRGRVPVIVRAHVTDTGRVDSAVLLSPPSAQVTRPFAEAALYAARRWSFTPARSGEERVPGEVILRFEFRPVARTVR